MNGTRLAAPGATMPTLRWLRNHLTGRTLPAEQEHDLRRLVVWQLGGTAFLLMAFGLAVYLDRGRAVAPWLLSLGTGWVASVSYYLRTGGHENGTRAA